MMALGRILLVLTGLLSALMSAGGEQPATDAAAASGRQPSDGRLFAGAYSTILRTSIITSTTATDFYTCATVTSTLIGCTGRRKRRRVHRRDLSAAMPGGIRPEQLPPALDGSQRQGDTSADKDKLLLTIFTTSTTTVTFSTKTINSATTVKITYQCTTSGMSLYPSC